MFFAFEKSRNTFVENLDQPVRYTILDFEDRPNPEVELLPVDVLITGIKQPLPGNSTGFLVGALARVLLESIRRFAHRLAFSFFHASVSRAT